jgi:hypothetical protein
VSDQAPITIPPVDVLREQLVAKQAEVRRLRKLLLLAKAVTPSGSESMTGRERVGKEGRP